MKAVKNKTAFLKQKDGLPAKTIVKAGYKETKLGWIPEEWSILEFDEIAVRSKSTYSNKKDKQSFKCIELEHINQNVGSINGFANSLTQKSTKTRFESGQILFGKLRPYLKKFWQADFNGVCSTEIWVLDGREKITANKFLFYLIQSNRFIQAANATSGSKMPRADWWFVSKFPFSLPPLPEQQKIASILNTWDKAIATQEQLIAQKQELKKGLMQQLLTGKKRFNWFSEDWEEVRLNELVKINPKAEDLPKEFNYISLESVKNGLLKSTLALNKTNAPSRAQRVLKRDDVIFQTVRPYQKNNYYFDLTGNYVASTGYAQLRCSSEIAKFVYYLIHTEQFVNKVLSRCTGSNYPAINPSSLGKIKIRIPKSKAEKLMISDLLTDVDKELNNLFKKTNQYIEQKQGLMQQLLTGEKRVRV